MPRPIFFLGGVLKRQAYVVDPGGFFAFDRVAGFTTVSNPNTLFRTNDAVGPVALAGAIIRKCDTRLA